jgi:hypothetical protein
MRATSEYKVLVGKLVGKKLLGRPSRIWNDDMKIVLKKWVWRH